MITIPTSTGSPAPASNVTPMIGEEYLMMAAAQMHSEGRLVQGADTVKEGMKNAIEAGDIKGRHEWESPTEGGRKFDEPPGEDKTDAIVKELDQRASNTGRSRNTIEYPLQYRTIKGVGTRI